MNRLTYETAWLIWSHKHSAWWGPDRAGYTTSIAHAGVYDEAEALDIERSSAGYAPERSEGRPLMHCITDGVAPMRERTVVALMTEVAA